MIENKTMFDKILNFFTEITKEIWSLIYSISVIIIKCMAWGFGLGVAVKIFMFIVGQF